MVNVDQRDTELSRPELKVSVTRVQFQVGACQPTLLPAASRRA